MANERTDEVVRLLKRIAVAVEMIAGARPAGAALGRTVADDADLDSKYGDPVLKFTPRDWTGANFKNLPFSQCPAELLDLVADSLDYFARKSDETGETTSGGKPKSSFQRKDAARARGWAARIRANGGPKASSEPQSSPFEESEWPEDNGDI